MPTHLAPRSAATLPPDEDAKKSELNFGHDFDRGFLFTSATTARTFLPNGQEIATPMDACTTELAPSAVRGLLRTTTGIITTIVSGIVTIAEGLWELVAHRSTVDDKKTLTASGGSAFATMTNGRTFQHNINEMTMLVNSRATEHFLDDELIPGRKDCTINPTLLYVPKDSKGTSEEAIVAETERQRAQNPGQTAAAREQPFRRGQVTDNSRNIIDGSWSILIRGRSVIIRR